MHDLDSLVAETLAGNLDAFGEIVASLQDMALGYAYSLLGDFEDARDAVQDAFIIAYRNLGDLRERERFPGWFRRIVLSACHAIARKRRPTIPLAAVAEAADHDEEPARIAERADVQAAVLAAINALSPPNRAATVLFYIDGYSLNEVADFLQVPLGTVKRRLHDSRSKLRESMMDMVGDSLQKHRLTPTFGREVLKRIRHWERFKGTDEEKVAMVEADPEWVGLVEFEIGLEPMSAECRQIRQRIADMEPCHEHYTENVENILGMIGAMTPGPILDCGQACEERKQQAQAYARALAQWRNGRAAGEDGCAREVAELLGKPTKVKVQLVNHLIRKLKDNSYSVYADEDEDFDRVESRIQHLDICNFNWRENLRIVLREIAAGKRLVKWGVPGGFYAHGYCPDRVEQLRGMMAQITAWAQRKGRRGKRARVLGAPTPEKRWLVASLCKHVSAQHAQHGSERLLPKPAV
jgi:RNA polymerase sigma factor (sigma-70 family)